MLISGIVYNVLNNNFSSQGQEKFRWSSYKEERRLSEEFVEWIQQDHAGFIPLPDPVCKYVDKHKQMNLCNICSHV